jgi:hypothetical protein
MLRHGAKRAKWAKWVRGEMGKRRKEEPYSQIFPFRLFPFSPFRPFPLPKRELTDRDRDPSRFGFLGFWQFEFEYAVLHSRIDTLSIDGIGKPGEKRISAMWGPPKFILTTGAGAHCFCRKCKIDLSDVK